MTSRDLLDQLLQSGRELARRGIDLAGKGLNLPPEGPERDQALANLGKGAAVGGLVALLIGTRGGRRLAGPLLQLGGIAAIGAIGFSAWKKWQADQSGAPASLGQPISELAGHAAELRSMTLIRAMIAAANSDGHIDARERSLITDRLAGLELPDTERRLLQGEFDRRLDAAAVAAMADSPSAAAEIYLTSLLVTDDENEVERDYLNQLAKALNLPWDLVRQLEAEAAAE